MRSVNSPVRTWCVATLVVAAFAFATPALAWTRAQPAELGASAALVDFYKLFVAGECDLLGKMLADDFQYAVTGPSGLAPKYISKSAFLTQGCPLPFQPYLSNSSTWNIIPGGGDMFATMTLTAAVNGGPPITKDGTANCTFAYHSQVSGTIDNNGLLVYVNELFPDHTRVYQWLTFCAKGTPFPLPNAAPGTPLDELLITFSNQMWTGNCEAFGAILADNYTEVDNGGSVVTRAGAIKACTSAVGTMMLSGEPMGPTVVSGNTAVVMNHGAVFVRDPVTTEQCGLQFPMSQQAHFFLDSTTNTMKVDRYSAEFPPTALGELAAKCHMNPADVEGLLLR